jgi:undecaprenyl diphosphate synthase
MESVSASPEPEHPLVHVAVAGGTLGEWDALTEAQWDDRLRDLGKVADHVGASWLTIRPYEEGRPVAVAPASARRTRRLALHQCEILASPDADGRRRLADAVDRLVAAGIDITDDAIINTLNQPALADPDLVVVLGPPNRLPPSLVWELAYSELVFLDVAWADLQPDHLGDAISAFAHRHRRFGGLD